MRRLATLAAVALLAGCTGVPTSSPPQIISTQPIHPPAPQGAGPDPHDDARDIVSKFLEANSGNDANHNTARQFLTASESTRWTDDRVTLVDDAHVGAASSNGTVTVDGSRLGTVDSTGVYTPVRTGDGGGQASFLAQFHVTRTKDGLRIDKLPPGLLVDAGQFSARFQQRAIYFYDAAAEQHLVPEPHYTQLFDPATLSDWLVQNLAAGPRDALSNAEVTEFPAQTDPAQGQVRVTVGTDASQPATITIPGASRLDRRTRTKLAVQVAATLAQVAEIGDERQLRIVDAGEVVPIPRVGQTFTAGDFAAEIEPARPVPRLYYVDSAGGVVDEFGSQVQGRIGSGYYDLKSVAIAAGRGTEGLLVAGTRTSGGTTTLDVGTEAGTFDPVPNVVGDDLTRPFWSPTENEVWIGDGTTLYRVALDGTATAVSMSTPTGPATGRVMAVQFSPEGSRVAVVLGVKSDSGAEVGHVSVGVVVRDGDKVRVDGLTEISPAAVSFNDVAWNDDFKLFGVGHDDVTGKAGIFELQSDGSRFSERGIGVLPGEPRSITIAEGQAAAVEATGFVWKQSAGTWEGPQGSDTPGFSPTYAV